MLWIIGISSFLILFACFYEIVHQMQKQQEKSNNLADETREVQKILREIRDLLENIDNNTADTSDIDNDS